MERYSRRDFLKTSTATGVAAAALAAAAPSLATAAAKGTRKSASKASADKPALLGGQPVRAKGAKFPSWPNVNESDEKGVLDVLKSGNWFRGGGNKANEFEEAYKKLTGAKHCIAVSNGTNSLIASLAALDVGPGDEVIIPPYTFVATLNSVTNQFALPIFVDTDPETFQIDPAKIEAAITERTTAIMPVHIGGNPVDMNSIMAIAGKRKLPVIEDACQAHLAEYAGKHVGSIGTLGGFSFQVTKNLPSGEGGAVLTNDDELAFKVYGFHSNLRARAVGGYNFKYAGTRATNARMTEFQAALLLSQMTRIEANAKIRDANAKYLNEELAKIPGCMPCKLSRGATRNAYHLYMWRIEAEKFGLPRATILKALEKEGIPCSSGYSPLNKEEFVKTLLQSKAYRRIYPAAVLDTWAERNACPANDKVCEQAIWFTQTMLLGPRKDMEDIVAAVRKIQAHAAELAKLG